MTRPTRLSQEKLDDLLLKHRQQRNKDLQDQHTIAQRNILVRKMKLARKLQARQEAEAKRALLDTLSTDRLKPLTRSGMSAIASIGAAHTFRAPPGIVVIAKNIQPTYQPISDLIADDPYTDEPALPTIQELGQESLSDEPPQT